MKPVLMTNRTSTMRDVLRDALAGASEAWLTSAYVSPGACEMLGIPRRAEHIPVMLTVGRALEEGLPRQTHDYLMHLDGICRRAGGGVRAASPSCHSKLYCFTLQGGGTAGWIGSSNLTEHGLGEWIEANASLSDPMLFAEALTEVQNLWCGGLPPADPAVHTILPSRPAAPRLPAEPGSRGAPGIVLSLLARNGEVQAQAGLNWWRGAGRRRSPNEAYIALPRAQLDQAAQVFGSSNIGTVFRVVMHDGTEMDMRLEASGQRGRMEAKQISSDGDKRIFGEWILRRLLKLPEWTQVTRAHLEAYGRADIAFYRIGDDPFSGRPVVLVDFKP